MTRARALTSASFAAVFALAALTTVAFVPSAGALPCEDGPNEHVRDDVWATAGDPTHPQCGSLTDPCFQQEPWGCLGCGPDLAEWVIGPIECP